MDAGSLASGAGLPSLLLARARSVRMLGLAGAPGAGKSTLARALAMAVPGAVVVPMDGFHLTTSRLTELGRVERRGAVDTFDAQAYVALLRKIRQQRESVSAPGFDRTREEPVPAAISVAPDAPLVVTEGNYLLLDDPPWSAVRTVLDEVWFVEIPESLRVQRLIERFVAYGMDRAAATERVRTGSDAVNARLVAATRDRADIVVSPSGELRV
ncbi:MAG: nucleoside/nucleotide kinase family protein [Actinomycetota bacterium]|nr:nucleoside/nucleotide kinase family protein [Actinomycetota bacterium]